MADSQGTTVDEVEDIAVVEHFRDGRFFNPGVPEHSFFEALKWMRNRKIGPWRKWIPSTPGPPPPVQVDGDALQATFVNHSTVLLQTGGRNILTDPVWSRRVSPVRFMGPERHRAPGILFEDLPPIHCILISHNHYDHMDLPSLRQLRERWNPPIVTGIGSKQILVQDPAGNLIELFEPIRSEARLSR